MRTDRRGQTGLAYTLQVTQVDDDVIQLSVCDLGLKFTHDYQHPPGHRHTRFATHKHPHVFGFRSPSPILSFHVQVLQVIQEFLIVRLGIFVSFSIVIPGDCICRCLRFDIFAEKGGDRS